MKALRIALYSEGQTELPLAYGHYIQGALYACLLDHFTQVHETGYRTTQGRKFRMLTFGPIQGASNVDPSRKTLTLQGQFSIEVRSPIDAVIDEIAEQLRVHMRVRLASARFSVIGLEERQKLIFPTTCVARMISPVTVHLTTPDGHTTYFSPLDDGFSELIQTNARSKMEAAGIQDAGNLQLVPLPNTLKKRVTTYKGIYVTGWLGSFVMEAQPPLMELLYYAGLGTKNTQGFGMFDIDYRPLRQG
ncbi:MAG: CRISPR-associated endoribonuclease Cas6 [Atopobiaceae bacterium]